MNDTTTPEAKDNADLRAYIIERVNSGEYPDLNLHLISAHCYAGGFHDSPQDAADNHQHEHDGPGTIRNHDLGDLFWDAEKIATVILECVEGDTLDEQRTEVEDHLNQPDVEVRLPPGDHTHDYTPGQDWTVCLGGDTCTVYPRVYDIHTTRRADGTYGSGSSATITNAPDDIARGLLAARSALVMMDVQNDGNGLSRMAQDAMAQLNTSIALLYPLIYPDHAATVATTENPEG